MADKKSSIDQTVDLLVNIHNEAIQAAINEVATGRTMTNFGHVPEVVRALEWVMMDLERLKK